MHTLKTRATADVHMVASATKPEAIAIPVGSGTSSADTKRQRSAPPPRSSLAWATRTIGDSARPASADARLQARKDVVHLSGFTEPRSHKEFKTWAEIHLTLPEGTQI
eukprot:2626428-Amphidinium_carterae.1